MIRLDRENLPVDLLGSLQPAGLMVLDRNRQCFGNRCHDVDYARQPAGRNVFQENAHGPPEIALQQRGQGFFE